MKKLAFLFFLISSVLYSQNDELKSFDNLIGKTWVAEGSWVNGNPFKQEILMSFDLNQNIITSTTKGFTDNENKAFGKRSHGVRMFDTADRILKFWEFDIFGGVTEGTIILKEKNILYTYAYGDIVITDMWEYVNDYTYNFKVGVYKNAEWEQVFLITKFKAKE